MLAIGFMASIVFYMNRNAHPAACSKAGSLNLYQNDLSLWPSHHRFALILALITGMAIAALRTRSFQYTKTSFRNTSQHLLAGLLMGLRAVIPSGGNDSQ
ncbi:MAG: hypothetical protein HRU20_12180 [Pseudomonadales bacterium]|nr:hypothetical protein [Pseudomonadales bacterium]